MGEAHIALITYIFPSLTSLIWQFPVRSQAQNRLKEVSEAIEARKKMIKESGYGNGDDKRLEEELKVARDRLADLQAKHARIDHLKHQLKVAQNRNADLKMKNWMNGSNEQSDAELNAESLQPKRVPKRR